MNDKTSSSSGDFATGYRFDLEGAAKQAWEASGDKPEVYGNPLAVDDRPLPEAFTLASNIFWWTNQGQVGSCAADASTQALQISISSAVSAGETFDEIQLSRRFTWYAGRKYDGSVGSGDTGISISGVMRALADGCPPESEWVYKPEWRYLDQRPPQSVIDSAKGRHLTGVMDSGLDDAAKRQIFNGLPIVDGYRWSPGWDQGLIDQYGRTTGVRVGRQGHALCRIGWVNSGVWDSHQWWHIKNSHGPIYPLPSPEMRAKVQGYASSPAKDRCYCFWVRDDMLGQVFTYGAESICGAGVEGIKVRRVYSWRLTA